MKIYKKLAGQTLVYGLGTIVPKILNYVILTAYYTRLFKNVENFGIITELYAYVTFLMVILTYGTETGFFRFSQGKDGDKVFSSLLISLFTTSVSFILIVIIFLKKIAEALSYQGHESYILILGIIVGIDAFSTIPFAKLRKEEKALKFAILRITNVLVTIIAVLFFYEVIPRWMNNFSILGRRYDSQDVLYVFLSNLIASAVILILLLPEIFSVKIKYNGKLLRNVLNYSFPLLIAGLAGIINETLDRALMKHLLGGGDHALYVLGIYGANYRIAMLLYIFVQMFRYAVEPFYFNNHGKKDEKETNSGIMRMFIAVMIILIMIMLFYLHYIKFFIPLKYHEGLKIIPVVLTAFFFYGIFFNQSIWYKLTKKTGYAILLTVLGALITIIANVFFIRKYSYMAAAYGHFFAYLVMTIVSYVLSRKYYKIDYHLVRIGEYILVALVIFGIRFILIPEIRWIEDITSIFLIIAYCLYILKRENLLKHTISDLWKLK